MIRVLIADESARITDNIQRRLQLEEDLTVVGTAKDGEYAVQEALRLQPDVALIDSALPGLDGVATTEMLAQHLPRTGVIMMSMEGENEAYRHAMLAGAREFLQKPFKGDDLVAAIRRVHAFEQRKVLPAAAPAAAAPGAATTTTGEVFTVIGGKGGVGKTVIAANLGVALAKSTGRKVALVDLSLQFGDVAAILNLPIDRTIADLAANDAVADRDVIQQVLVEGPEGIRVLLAPLSPELADYVTTPHLRALMDELKRTFDYIVVDAPAYLNEITLDAIEMADSLVVVTDFSMTSIKNARLALSVMDVLKIEHDRIRVVANHHRGAGQALDKPTAESYLKQPVALEIPYDTATVNGSINQGVPFITQSPQSPIALCLMSLAAQLTPKAQSADNGEQGPPISDKKKKQRRILGFARG